MLRRILPMQRLQALLEPARKPVSGAVVNSAAMLGNSNMAMMTPTLAFVRAASTNQRRASNDPSMAKVLRTKPHTPGVRHRVRIDRSELWQGPPLKELVKGAKRISGRNNTGRITVWHRGGGNKRKLRNVDTKREKEGQAIVQRLEYDPNRSAYIALIKYPESSSYSYIIAPEGLQPGDNVEASRENPLDIKIGNAMCLEHIPVGTAIHNLEIIPGMGGKMIRAAGTSCKIMEKNIRPGFALIRLNSKEQRIFNMKCVATIGQVSNPLHKLEKLGKAGANRWRGWRPTVRGVAMNPIDHPHGGGEGRTKGRPSVTPWGKPTKGGYKTRDRKKKSNKWIQQTRHGLKKKM